MSSVETGQMSAVETGQMSAVETRQMSSAETRQMSTGKTGRCPVPILCICLVATADISRADICLVSTADISSVARTDICPVSTHNVEVSKGLNCSNITMLKSQKSQLSQYLNVQVSDSRSGPKSAKMARNGSRIVARTQEAIPRHAAAISKPLGPVPRPKSAKKVKKWPVWGLALGS